VLDICLWQLRRIQQKELTYENIYILVRNGGNAQFGFVFVGTDDHHNNDNSRSYSDTANNDAADHNPRRWRSDNPVIKAHRLPVK